MHNSFRIDNNLPQFIISIELKTFDDLPKIEILTDTDIICCIFYGNFTIKNLTQYFTELKNKNLIVVVATTPEQAVKLKAHGIHMRNNFNQIKQIKNQYPDLLLGVENIKTKHIAMELAENGADYLFFGQLGFTKNNVELCKWWTKIMRTPAILPSETAHDINYANPEFIAIDYNLINSFDKKITIGYIINKLKSELMD